MSVYPNVKAKSPPLEGELEGGVSLTYPPGVSAILAGVPLCPEAQANVGTCGESSEIGEATASAGVGNLNAKPSPPPCPRISRPPELKSNPGSRTPGLGHPPGTNVSPGADMVLTGPAGSAARERLGTSTRHRWCRVGRSDAARRWT
jgi:hypothetical protein